MFEPGSADYAAITDHALTTTRGVRKRLDFDRPVDDDVIFDCIDVAEQAPTGGNNGSRRWMIIRDQATKDRMAELYLSASGRPGLFDSVIQSAWSFMVALRARGLGTVWTTMYLNEADAVADLLHLPDDVTQICLHVDLPARFSGDRTGEAWHLDIERIPGGSRLRFHCHVGPADDPDVLLSELRRLLGVVRDLARQQPETAN